MLASYKIGANCDDKIDQPSIQQHDDNHDNFYVYDNCLNKNHHTQYTYLDDYI